MRVTVRGIKRVRAKGRDYYYHRATGTRLRAVVGSPEFFLEIERLNKKIAGTPVPLEGTLGGLMCSYKASPEFGNLADRTKVDYRKVLDYLGKMADMPLLELDSAFVLNLRDIAYRARKRRFANYVVQVLRLVLAWGQPRKIVKENAAEKVPLIRRPRSEAAANRPWTDHELEVVLARAGVLRPAVALGAFAGLREGDALRMPWSCFNGDVLEWVQAKTGDKNWVPAHERLRAILEETPRRSPVIVIGVHGRPFTGSGFRASFFKLLRRLQAEGKIGDGLTFHGLRHTAATRLAEAGADTQTIMAITGHKTEAMVSHYTKAADRKRRARAGIRLLEGNGNTDLENRDGKLAAASDGKTS
jgi:integrase